MKLRITSKTGFKRGIQHGSAFSRAVEVKKSLDPLTIPKVNQGKPGLFMKKAAEATGAQPGITRKISQRLMGCTITDEAGNALDCGMNVPDRYITRMLKAFPREKQGVGNAAVQKRLVLRGGKIGKEVAQALPVLMSKAPARVKFQRGLSERAGSCIDGNPANHSAAKDPDPHAKVGGLLDEYVILRGKQPEEVSATNFIPPASDEVDAPATRNQIQLKLGMSMAAVRGGEIVILPNSSIQFWRQMKMLTHDKKR